MKLGEVVVTHVYYNFTKFHQNRMKNKSFINSPFFCSEFQSVSRIVKIVHSANVMKPDGLKSNSLTVLLLTWIKILPHSQIVLDGKIFIVDIPKMDYFLFFFRIDNKRPFVSIGKTQSSSRAWWGSETNFALTLW